MTKPVKSFNKAIISKTDKAGNKEEKIVELLNPFDSKKKMISYLKENYPEFKIHRIWNGVIGENKVGQVQSASSEFVKALMTKGGMKKSREVLKAMVNNG
jgi:hypothetical protein